MKSERECLKSSHNMTLCSALLLLYTFWQRYCLLSLYAVVAAVRVQFDKYLRCRLWMVFSICICTYRYDTVTRCLFTIAALRQSKLMKKLDFSGIQSDPLVRWFVVLRRLFVELELLEQHVLNTGVFSFLLVSINKYCRKYKIGFVGNSV